MHKRFANAEKHEPDTHTCGKEHRKPRDIFVLGLSVIRTQLYLARFTKSQNKNAYQDDGDGQHVKPTEILGNEALHTFENLGRKFWRQSLKRGYQKYRKNGWIKDFGVKFRFLQFYHIFPLLIFAGILQPTRKK